MDYGGPRCVETIGATGRVGDISGIAGRVADLPVATGTAAVAQWLRIADQHVATGTAAMQTAEPVSHGSAILMKEGAVPA